MRVAILLVLGGCSFAPAGFGGASGDDGSGTDAAAVQPDAMLMPTMDDLDGDGIPNATDNCPTVPNAHQWNEDGDAFGDACDPCPQYAALQIDSDDDGIGDDCDPHPDTPGDTLVLFEGFNVDGALPASWTTSGAGTWTVTGGKLAYTPAANTPGFALYPLPSAGAHTVDTVAITGSTTNTTQVIASVIDATPTLSKFFMCSVSVYESLFRFARWNNAWAELSSTSASPPPPNTYPIVASSTATQESCVIEGSTLLGANATFGGTRVGMRSVNVAVEFPYIAVYRSP
jgi:hypothetical protein